MNTGCAAEQDAWRELKDGWRPLYGDVEKNGVAIEWHDFRTEHTFVKDRTLHPNTLDFCIRARPSNSWRIFSLRRRTPSSSACGRNASRANASSAQKNC